jgi:UPF0271 protein
MARRIRIDINADAGEATDPGTEEPLLEVATSLNLACGVHAGNETTITRLSAAARKRGVGVGAHPGLAAGRRLVAVSAADAAEAVRSQVALFKKASRAPLRHVKLHGTLYHAARDPAVAQAVVEVMQELAGVILVAQAGSPLLAAARAAAIPVASEAFLDRAYLADGTLVPRGRPGALLLDPQVVAERALEVTLRGQLRAVDGSLVTLKADTLCLHGDTPGASELGAAARKALEEAGVDVRPLGSSR